MTRIFAFVLLLLISLAPLRAQTPLAYQVEPRFDEHDYPVGFHITRLFEGDSLYLPLPQYNASYIAYTQAGKKLYIYEEFIRLDEPTIYRIAGYDLQRREADTERPMFMGLVPSLEDIPPGAWYTLFSTGERFIPLGDDYSR